MAQTKPRKAPSRTPAAAHNSTSAARRPRPKRRRRAGHVWGALTLAFLATVAMAGGFLCRSVAVQKYFGAVVRHGFHPPTSAEAFPGQTSLNMLVIGRDYDYSDKDQILDTRGRSDMLMVARLDFARHDVSLLSIPRDTRARIAGHGTTKINAAYKYGGPALTARTVQENFGIPGEKFVALDFQGFEKAIDLLGGVDLYVDRKMDYDDNWGHLHIHLKLGPQHLNGQQAMGFVRFRHSDSDLVRVQRQQALLAALKAKMRRPQTLAKLPDLLDMLDSHLESDLSTDQKLALAGFVHETPREQIVMTTLPSRPAGASVVTDWAQASPVIQRMFGVVPAEQVAASVSGGRRHRRHRHPSRLAELP